MKFASLLILLTLVLVGGCTSNATRQAEAAAVIADKTQYQEILKIWAKMTEEQVKASVTKIDCPTGCNITLPGDIKFLDIPKLTNKYDAQIAQTTERNKSLRSVAKVLAAGVVVWKTVDELASKVMRTVTEGSYNVTTTSGDTSGDQITTTSTINDDHSSIVETSTVNDDHSIVETSTVNDDHSVVETSTINDDHSVVETSTVNDDHSVVETSTINDDHSSIVDSHDSDSSDYSTSMDDHSVNDNSDNSISDSNDDNSVDNSDNSVVSPTPVVVVTPVACTGAGCT